MDSADFIVLIMLAIVLYSIQKRKKFLCRQIIQQKTPKEKSYMKELAGRLIGKKCMVVVFDSSVTGIIREVTENAILLEVKNTTEIINLSFIVRIREIPDKNK